MPEVLVDRPGQFFRSVPGGRNVHGPSVGLSAVDSKFEVAVARKHVPGPLMTLRFACQFAFTAWQPVRPNDQKEVRDPNTMSAP